MKTRPSRSQRRCTWKPGEEGGKGCAKGRGGGEGSGPDPAAAAGGQGS